MDLSLHGDYSCRKEVCTSFFPSVPNVFKCQTISTKFNVIYPRVLWKSLCYFTAFPAKLSSLPREVLRSNQIRTSVKEINTKISLYVQFSFYGAWHDIEGLSNINFRHQLYESNNWQHAFTRRHATRDLWNGKPYFFVNSERIIEHVSEWSHEQLEAVGVCNVFGIEID